MKIKQLKELSEFKLNKAGFICNVIRLVAGMAM